MSIDGGAGRKGQAYSAGRQERVCLMLGIVHVARWLFIFLDILCGPLSYLPGTHPDIYYAQVLLGGLETLLWFLPLHVHSGAV